MTPRWLFADQFGPHHLQCPDQPVLLVAFDRLRDRPALVEQERRRGSAPP